VDRLLISVWKPWWAVFYVVVIDEEFAWSLAALAAAAFGCCLRWQLRLARACEMLIQV
jgi:hypothetical protein